MLAVLVALYFPAARPVARARFSGCYFPVYFSGTLHRTENHSFLRDRTEKFTFQHRLVQFAVACLLIHWLPVHPSLLCQLLVHRLSVHEFHVFAGSPFMRLPVASVARSPACCFLTDCLFSCCLFTICLVTAYLFPDVTTSLFIAVLFK